MIYKWRMTIRLKKGRLLAVYQRLLFVGDGDLDINSGLDVDGSDVLDDRGGGVQVYQSFMDAHLETVPGL